MPRLRRPSGPPRPNGAEALAQAAELIAFWLAAGPRLWFAKDEAFDERFRSRFLDLHEAALLGEWGEPAADAETALARVLLFDQFPRNAFRGTPRMYASDAQARDCAGAAIAAGFDLQVARPLQAFFYLPFSHSEAPADQDRAVALCQRLGGTELDSALWHRAIVQRFGRFPHRNAILGRASSEAERQYLREGGFQG